MSLVSRIQKLEAAIKPAEDKVTFIGWAECEWRECEGLTRGENESIDEFKRRVMKVTDKKFIWVW
jgi:hypothetical protein